MATPLESKKEELINLLGDSKTVYAIIRHVSASGMSRIIDFYVIKDERPYWLSGCISMVTGFKLDKSDRGLRVYGCGMDMAYHVVSSLSEELYGDYKVLRSEII